MAEYQDTAPASTGQHSTTPAETPAVANTVEDGEASETSDMVSDIVTSSDMVRLDMSAGVWDKFRMFKSHMFSVTGNNWSQLSESRLLCLGAQTSVDRY